MVLLNRIKGKKGEVDVLKRIILVLVVAGIFILLIFKTVIPELELKNKMESCRSSLIMADVAREVTMGTIGRDIRCPAETLEITSKKAMNKDKKIDHEKVADLIATELYDCVDKTGNRKLNPFRGWEGEHRFCLVCSNIEFSDDFIKKQKEEGESGKMPGAELQYYLAKENIPGKDFTFFEAINGREPSPEELRYLQDEAGKKAPPYIATSDDYTVMWQVDYYGKTVWGMITHGVGGMAAGMGLIAVSIASGVITVGADTPLAAAGVLAGSGIAAGGWYAATRKSGISQQTYSFLTSDAITGVVDDGTDKAKYCEIMLN